MKIKCCSTCHQEIDQKDFFLETRKGKICSDCLVQAGPVEDDCAHLFKPRDPRGQRAPIRKQTGKIIVVPFKEAL